MVNKIKIIFYIFILCFSLTRCSQSHPGIEIGNPTSNPPPTPTLPTALVGNLLILQPNGDHFFQTRFISTTRAEVSLCTGTPAAFETIQTVTGNFQIENSVLTIQALFTQTTDLHITIVISDPSSNSRSTQLLIENNVVEANPIYTSTNYSVKPMQRIANSVGGIDTGDFDGDGHPDVALFQVTMSTEISDRHEFAVIFGNNSESLGEPVLFNDDSHTPIYYGGVVSDVDHDGLSDIILFYQKDTDPNYLAIRYGSRDRSFSRREEITLSGSSDTAPALLWGIGDLYGNNALELFIENSTHTESCPDPILGCAYSIFPISIPSGTASNVSLVSGQLGETINYSGKQQVTFEDLDSDALKEIIFTSFAEDRSRLVVNIFSLAPERNSGEFQNILLPPSDPATISSSILFTDLNHDHLKDLIYVQSNFTIQSELYLIPATASKSFDTTHPSLIALVGGFFTPIMMRSVDMNEDSKDDLILMDQSGNIQLLIRTE